MIKRRNIFLTLLLMFVFILPLFLMSCGSSSKNNKTNNDDNKSSDIITNNYNITINQTTGGKISASKTKAKEGELIKLSYTLNKGYTFNYFIVKDSDNNVIEVNDNYFIMPAKNVTVSGHFTMLSTEKYNIFIAESKYGDILYETDIRDDIGEGLAYGGSNIQLYFNVNNDDYYKFVSWNVIDSSNNIIEVINNKFVMPESNVTISVNVEEIFYTITIDENIKSKGNINVSVNNSDDNTKCHYNDYVTVSFTPIKGVTFNNWKIFDGAYNITSDKTNYSFQVRKGNVTISAELEAKHYTIDFKPNYNCKSQALLDSNGNSITQYSSTTTAKTGDVLQVQFEPNANYKLSYITIQEYTLYNYTYRYGDLVEYDEDYKFIMPASDIIVSIVLEFVSDNYYTITYDLDDDVINGVDNPNGFYSGDGHIDLNSPTKEGYNFNYWVDQNYKQYSEYINTKEIGEDLILKAEFYPIWYNIEFNSNSGSGEMNSMTYLTYDSDITLNKNSFTKDYYDFIGWALTSDGDVLYSDEGIVKNLTKTNSETIVLYAKWAPTTYTITYIDDNNTSTFEYTYFDRITIKDSSKTGYTFNYYEVSKAEGNWNLYNQYNYNDSLKNMYGNPTLNAHYTINQYTITFVLDNGNDNIAITKDYGSTFDKPNDPIKDGCEFIGWDKDIPSNIPSSNLTITALYKNKTYNINYYDQDGKDFSGTHYEIYPTTFVHDTNTLLDIPKKTGYKFDGYYKESDCSGNKIFALQTETSDVNLYAKWTPIIYSVKFDNMSSTQYLYQEFTYDVPANLATNQEFYQKYHHLYGWTTNYQNRFNLDAKEFDLGQEVLNLCSEQGDEIVLYAMWEPDVYTVKFVDENDIELNTITYRKTDYNYNTRFIFPEKEGYTIDHFEVVEGTYSHSCRIYTSNGWKFEEYTYTLEEGQNIINISEDYCYYPNGSATIKGYFNINQYTITIKDGNDVIYSTSINYKATIGKSSLEENTTKVGYDFVSYDKELPDIMPAENIILNTTWIAQVYDIEYKLVGDLELTDVTFENYPETHTYNETTKLVFPKRTGYDAVGWYINSDGSGDEYIELKENTITGTNGIITLYIDFTQSIYITNNAGIITGLTDYGKTLSHLIIPEYINGVKITYIVGDSFENDLNLKMLTITSDLNFQSSALAGCHNLVEVINLTSISDSLFSNNAKPWYISHDENYVSRVVKYSNGVSYYIDDNDMVAVTYEGNSTSVTLDSNCNKIRAYAFYNANMQEIIIPDSVIEINECAFYNCDELLTFTFHDKITSLGMNVLNDCDKLTTIYYNIPYLNHTFSTGNNHIIYNCPLLANIIIGDNVKVISHDIFAYNSSFKSITIPKSVEKIEVGAFYGCGLSTVIFEVGSNVSKIESAFMGVYKLYTVYLTNDYLYKSVDGQEALGYMIIYVKNVYVLKSVYENENNTNSYFTNETKFTQPTETVTVDGNEYYLFTKI